MSDKRKDEIKAGLDAVRASLNVIFELPCVDGFEVVNIDDSDFAVQLLLTAAAMSVDIAQLEADPGSASRIYRKITCLPDSIDFLNQLADNNSDSFAVEIERSVLEVFDMRGMFTNEMSKPERDFMVKHAVCVAGIPALVQKFIALLRECSPEDQLERLSPVVDKKLRSRSVIKLPASGRVTPGMMKALTERFAQTDQFSRDRVFRYVEDHFYPANLTSIRDVKDFYGFTEVRHKFEDHFAQFSSGRSNLPLLISSLPGLGKTHFSIAFAKAHEELTIILPEPEDLERPLEHIIAKLAARKSRKFVLFFDDVDTRSVDWYFFRTNVGGSYQLPPNVNIVIASNYRFPANISSRGRGVTFEMFDEVTCQGMVHDFLCAMGMAHPPSELVAVVASEYVSEFGQKKFEELSPRTLVRYFERYRSSPEKRRRSLELSREEMVPQPDAQVFFEFNVRIVRNLYGEEGVEELKRQQMDMELS